MPIPIDLFGGALRCSLPEGWLDASDARPVPDHQEVWLEPAGGGDRSVVVELLERVEECGDDESGEFHFCELARTNEATRATLHSSARLPPEAVHSQALREQAVGYLLHGVQVLQPRHEGGGSAPLAVVVELQLRLVVLRLAAQATDLLVSVSRPTTIIDGNGSAAQATGSPSDLEAQADADLLAAIINTIEVCDWGLFQGDAAG